MAFQLVPDVLAVVFDTQKTSAVRMQNTLYFRNLSGWSGAQALTVATAAGDEWGAEVMPLLDDEVNFWRVRYKDLGAEFGAEGEISYNVNGADEGDPYTLAIACGVSFRAAGPPKQGRVFISGHTESQVSGDFFTGTHAQDCRDAMAAVAAAGEAALSGTAHVIVSRYLNGALRANGVASDVLSYQFHSNVWTQRDRRPGQGS